jgi:hypothetical protein
VVAEAQAIQTVHTAQNGSETFSTLLVDFLTPLVDFLTPLEPLYSVTPRLSHADADAISHQNPASHVKSHAEVAPRGATPPVKPHIDPNRPSEWVDKVPTTQKIFEKKKGKKGKKPHHAA